MIWAVRTARSYAPTMPWWDDKLPAQLGGVRFHVDRASKRGGRRSVAHEFPGVDEAYVEDSGAAPQRYRVDAFLVGPDYHARLQELEEVLEGPGPLEFHHPDRGILWGLWLEGEYETQHHKNRQGYATVGFTLVQNGPPIPLIFDEPAGRVRAAAASVLGHGAATFQAGWSGKNPLNMAAHALARLNGKLMSAYTKATAGLGPIEALRRELHAFERGVDALGSSRGAWAGALQALVRAFMRAVIRRLQSLGRAGSSAGPQALRSAVDELRSFALGPDAQGEYQSLVAGSAGKLSQKAAAAKRDLDALTVLVDATVLAAAAESLTELALPTADAAAELGQVLADGFDSLLAAELGDETIGSELHDAVLELEAQVLAYLTEAGGALPAMGSYVVPPGAAVPLLLVAYWRAGAGPGFLAELDSLLAANPGIEDPLALAPELQLRVVSP